MFGPPASVNGSQVRHAGAAGAYHGTVDRAPQYLGACFGVVTTTERVSAPLSGRHSTPGRGGPRHRDGREARTAGWRTCLSSTSRHFRVSGRGCCVGACGGPAIVNRTADERVSVHTPRSAAADGYPSSGALLFAGLQGRSSTSQDTSSQSLGV